MRRITTVVLVVMILGNGGVTMLEASGVANDWGVELAPGVSEEVDEITAAAQQGFSPGGGLGDTLFGLFAAAGSTFELFVTASYSFPAMFLNIGIPGWMVWPLFAPFYVLALFDLIYVFTQRAL